MRIFMECFQSQTHSFDLVSWLIKLNNPHILITQKILKPPDKSWKKSICPLHMRRYLYLILEAQSYNVSVCVCDLVLVLGQCISHCELQLSLCGWIRWVVSLFCYFGNWNIKITHGSFRPSTRSTLAYLSSPRRRLHRRKMFVYNTLWSTSSKIRHPSASLRGHFWSSLLTVTWALMRGICKQII